MAEFETTFGDLVAAVNREIENDAGLRAVLDRYTGRYVTLEIADDALYLFTLSPEGVRHTCAPDTVPDDMYIGMTLEQAKRIIHTRDVSFADIFSIKRRNIGFGDIDLAMKLFAARKK